MRSSASSNARQGGFSLVEVLVALVVLSVGMLGIAALYVESLRSGRTALLRTQAVTLASDMADRIRANRNGRKAYETVVARTNSNAACAAGCTSAALAILDKALWTGALQDALPGATGVVSCDDTTVPATYTITVTWVEAGQTDPGQTNPNSYEVRIQA
jgi:type IV pilus assembly protein PilV